MKIAICGSMSSSKKMMEIKSQLEERGHRVLSPVHTEKFASGEIKEETQEESAKNKMEGDLIRDYYRKIAQMDAVFIVNEKKNGIEGYIGGNSFLEMGFAYTLEKKIFILNKIPEISYGAEIIAMKPICLEGDLELIDSNKE